MNDKLTADFVRSRLDYNPDTGLFTWRPRPLSEFSAEITWRQFNGRRVNKVAGCIGSKGYLVINISKNWHRAHRLAWLVSTGSWPEFTVDHINGIRTDNRLCNLRMANFSENVCNAKRPKNNTSGVKGVTFDKSRNKWQAQLRFKGKKTPFVGRFDSILDAERAVREARIKLHGEFANHG